MKILKRGKKRGIALIMALWILVALAIVCTSFAYMMRIEMRITKDYSNGVKAHYLAKAGIDHALGELKNDINTTDSLHEHWFTIFSENFGYIDYDGDDPPDDYDEMKWDEKWWSLGEGGYQVRLIDEAGMHNINAMEGGIKHSTSLVGLEDLLGEGQDPPPQAVTDKADSIRAYRTTVKGHPYDTIREIQKVVGINDDTDGDGKDNNPLVKHWDELTVYSEDPDTTLGGVKRALYNVKTDTGNPVVDKARIEAGLKVVDDSDSPLTYPTACYLDDHWPPADSTEAAEGIYDKRLTFDTVGEIGFTTGCLGWSYRYTWRCKEMVPNPSPPPDEVECNQKICPYSGSGTVVCPKCGRTTTPVGAVLSLTEMHRRERNKNMKRVADIFTVAPPAKNAIYYKPDANPDYILGPININTAPKWALCSLIQVSEIYAKRIIRIRHYPDYESESPAADDLSDCADGATLHAGFTFGVEDTVDHGRGEITLVKSLVGGTYQDMSDQVTVRSDRFRVVSTGKVLKGVEVIAQRKIEVVVDRHFHDGGGPMEILYWSETVPEY